MPSLSWDNLVAQDIVLLIVLALVYVLLVWVAMGISLFLVFNRDNDRKSEAWFDQRWYKWKKQYMWHELWFRTHVIILLCEVVIFSYETSFPKWFPPVCVFIFLMVTIGLKFTSRKVENRVPSADDKKQLYSRITSSMRSASGLAGVASEEFNEVGSSSNVNGTTKGDDDGVEAKLSRMIELQNQNGSTHTANASM